MGCGAVDPDVVDNELKGEFAMTEKANRQLIRDRALYAKERADADGKAWLKESAELVLAYLKDGQMEFAEIISSSAYLDVLREWTR